MKVSDAAFCSATAAIAEKAGNWRDVGCEEAGFCAAWAFLLHPHRISCLRLHLQQRG